MQNTQYEIIAFILLEMFSIFLTGGLIWFTTPFRKRKLPGDKLFLCLELCCVGCIIKDITFFIAELKFNNVISTIPFSEEFYADFALFFGSGAYFFEAFFLLYSVFLLKPESRILRIIKLPVLAIAFLRSFCDIILIFLPEEALDVVSPLYMSSILTKGYRICIILTVLTLVFVDVKMVVFYLLSHSIYELMYSLTPIYTSTAIPYPLVLAFAYIIIINRELEGRKIGQRSLYDR